MDKWKEENIKLAAKRDFYEFKAQFYDECYKIHRLQPFARSKNPYVERGYKYKYQGEEYKLYVEFFEHMVTMGFDGSPHRVEFEQGNARIYINMESFEYDED